MTAPRGARQQRSLQRWWRALLWSVAGVLLMVGAGVTWAQTVAEPRRNLDPGVAAGVANVDAATAALPGEVRGTVKDGGGALIPGAHLVLRDAAGKLRTTDADEEGRFVYTELPAGVYRLRVSCPEFETYSSAAITITPDASHAELAVQLRLPGEHVDVSVTATRRQMADDEIHAAERQRVFGLFPNFYMSFAPNPVPLDSSQKFGLALRATTDPTAFFTAGLVASGEQIRKTFPGYGGGTTGYAKRYGAAFADGFTGKMLGSAVFPSVFRQDPRYFYQGTGTVRQRARHAILSAVLARGDNGRWEPNYSHILGNAAAGALSTTYHPAADGPGKLALDNALLGTLGEAGVNLVREFVMKPFTRGVPVYAVTAANP